MDYETYQCPVQTNKMVSSISRPVWALIAFISLYDSPLIHGKVPVSTISYALVHRKVKGGGRQRFPPLAITAKEVPGYDGVGVSDGQIALRGISIYFSNLASLVINDVKLVLIGR